ncbi:tRNA1(Val) (adenine(37)-N6)-methyltransferase [Agrilactobacillus fermenti]|uniref:tRNA1(Val) (adenine(37)-N6)-methyltransferase n=1 Tax=Agrilactobacillus fermenti TaxID=2586909 RepID=UPI001E4BD690|nr:tRNA1(Val) (adenine(37)-N6)-methyltransferase [Agrilactobacillus fermenti]MCD2256247.1 tRNA1(Val) (adenine(37)-N6)-methyltransferase [Agrilactobacillus fermenti]
MLTADERIDQLYSSNLKIIQSSKYFAFGIDAILLADFSKVPPSGKIFDFCAGNGVVGLFLSHKTKAKITLIEIQPPLADMAARSIRLNQLQNQVTVENMDLRTITDHFTPDSIDYISCNPPYFRINEGSLTNPNKALAIARHELAVTIEDIIANAHKMLKTNGKLSLIFRPDRLDELFVLFKKYHLAPKRLRFVYPKLNDNLDANMVLVEAINRGRENGVKVEPPLYVYENDHYTKEVRRLVYGQ